MYLHNLLVLLLRDVLLHDRCFITLRGDLFSNNCFRDGEFKLYLPCKEMSGPYIVYLNKYWFYHLNLWYLQILDEVYRILHYVRVTPKLARPYRVTDELYDLSTMAMEYFKEHIEPRLPEIAYFGSDFFEFPGSLQSKFSWVSIPIFSIS